MRESTVVSTEKALVAPSRKITPCGGSSKSLSSLFCVCVFASEKSSIRNTFLSPSTGERVLSSKIFSASSTSSFFPASAGKQRQSEKLSLSMREEILFSCADYSFSQLKRSLAKVFKATRRLRASSNSKRYAWEKPVLRPSFCKSLYALVVFKSVCIEYLFSVKFA